MEDVPTDEEVAAILVLHERGLNVRQIADELALTIGDVVTALAIDAEEFPDEPLIAVVLH